jgi:prevent-host-death family protein
VSETYSTYEAKAKLSEILRKVESGRTVVISRHGKPIAEVRPAPREVNIEQRIEELVRQGALIHAPAGPSEWRPVARRPGALGRFLADRSE